MTELDKLEEYLDEHGYIYERIADEIQKPFFIDQIIVYRDESREKKIWEVICHPGSYGYEQGLLEIIGSIVQNNGLVEGYLTAEDVVKRLVKNNDGLATQS